VFLHLGRRHSLRDCDQIFNGQESDGVLIVGLKATIDRKGIRDEVLLREVRNKGLEL
jgi:hypothetical protein